MTNEIARVELAHGAGGRAMIQFLKEVIFPHFQLNRVEKGIGLPEADDGASIPFGKQEFVVTTDSHTVSPLFFPGGDIGKLAAAGTINDLAVMGANPLALTSSLVIEEGLPIQELQAILKSLATTAAEEQVAIIAGDTKVIPKGAIDQLFICTTGIGVATHGEVITDSGARPGDKIIITGSIGDHGIALLANRKGLAFDTDLKSDIAPLWSMLKGALKIGGVHAMKDPTRGGVAAALNELAEKSGVSFWIDETKLPFRREVLAASQMLGLDPLQVTCEGKAIVVVEAGRANNVLRAIKKHKYGKEARMIGEVKEDRPGLVIMRTEVGGSRIVQHPWAEAIPRVC